MNRAKTLALIALSALLVNAAPAFAQSTFIDFSADTAGSKPNGFSSVAAGGVTFFDTLGNDLSVFDYGTQSAGQALSVDNELDGSRLEMKFAAPANFLSLQFGNDDPKFTNSGDLAVLTLFSGASQVGQTTVVLNRDDLMNQTISFGTLSAPLTFDRATFAYTNSFLDAFTGGGNVLIGSTEIVDNINVNLVTAIPEPASVAMLLTGLLLLPAWRRMGAASPQ